MNSYKPTYLMISIMVATLALAACDKRTSSGETVGQKVDKAIDKTNEKVAAAGEKVGAEMGKAGEAVSNAASSLAASTTASAVKANTAMADGAIVTSINADLFKDPELSVLKIDVDAKQGVVVLNGLTPTEDARLRAGRIASAIKGVTRVENNLSVKKN